jgi:hypothetical protein
MFIKGRSLTWTSLENLSKNKRKIIMFIMGKSLTWTSLENLNKHKKIIFSLMKEELENH